MITYEAYSRQASRVVELERILEAKDKELVECRQLNIDLRASFAEYLHLETGKWPGEQ